MNRSTASNAIFAALCVCAIEVVVRLVWFVIVCVWAVFINAVAFLLSELSSNRKDSIDRA